MSGRRLCWTSSQPSRFFCVLHLFYNSLQAVILYLFARCLLDFVSRTMITVPLLTSFCVLDIVNVEPQVVGMLSFSLSGRQACLLRSAFPYIALPVCSSRPSPHTEAHCSCFLKGHMNKICKAIGASTRKILLSAPWGAPTSLTLVCLLEANNCV